MIQPYLRVGIEGGIGQDSCLPESPGNGKAPPTLDNRRVQWNVASRCKAEDLNPSFGPLANAFHKKAES